MIYHSQHSRTVATSAGYYENLPITWTYANKILDSGGQGHQQWSNFFQFKYVYATYLKRISYHVLHHCIFILSSYYRIISGWCVDKLLSTPRLFFVANFLWVSPAQRPVLSCCCVLLGNFLWLHVLGEGLQSGYFFKCFYLATLW